jgi:Ricin-type beta-trefoil lectin domain
LISESPPREYGARRKRFRDKYFQAMRSIQTALAHFSVTTSLEEIVMPKTIFVCLLCSLLSVPILAGSKAHAALIVNADSGKCLDVKFANTANRTPIRSVPCTASFSQQWKWEGLFLKGIGTSEPGVSKYLDVLGAGTADGTLVQLFQCNGSGAQQWQFTNGRLVNLHSGKCLDIGDGGGPRRQRFDSVTLPVPARSLRSDPDHRSLVQGGYYVQLIPRSDM